MTFCRICWTHYDPSALPAECPHLNPEHEYEIVGGVHRRVQRCDCEHCSAAEGQ